LGEARYSKKEPGLRISFRIRENAVPGSGINAFYAGRFQVLELWRGWEKHGFRRKNQNSGPRIQKVPGSVRMQFQDPEKIHFMQVNFRSWNFGAVGRSMVFEGIHHFMQVNFKSWNFGAVGRSMVFEERTRTQDPGLQKVPGFVRMQFQDPE
jgi:hypothetical protein